MPPGARGREGLEAAGPGTTDEFCRLGRSTPAYTTGPRTGDLP